MIITMLGGKGSGKTCFMAGINETFINKTTQEFRLEPSEENVNSTSFEHYQTLRMLGFINSENKTLQFPAPTTATLDMSFVLRHNNTAVCDFQWVDYKGGLIDKTFGAVDEVERREADELQGRILASEALMVFIDAIMLSNIDDINQCKEVTNLHQIYTIISQYTKMYSKYNKTIAIILTKCDSELVSDAYKANHYAKLIEKAHIVSADIIHIAHSMQWACGIVPVSAVGQSTESKKTNITTKRSLLPFSVDCQLVKYPDPINIDIALLFCIVEILKRYQMQSKSELQAIEQDYTRALYSNTFFRNWWERMNGRKSPKEMLKELISKRNDENIALELLTEQLDNLIRYIRGKVIIV